MVAECVNCDSQGNYALLFIAGSLNRSFAMKINGDFAVITTIFNALKEVRFIVIFFIFIYNLK